MEQKEEAKPGVTARGFIGLVTAALVMSGAYFIYAGAELAKLGGSLYYLPVGVLLVVAGVLFARRNLWGAYLYWIGLAVTAVWSLYEVGLEFWPLVPRLAVFAGVAIAIALLTPKLRGADKKPVLRISSYVGAAVLALGLIATIVEAFQPVWLVKPTSTPEVAKSAVDTDPGNWVGFGRTPDGTQHAPFSQITPDNVANLKVAWTFRTGDIAYGGAENQNAPLQIGDVLYACTTANKIFAINAITGEQKWKYDPKLNAPAYNPTWQRCRSLAYFETKPQAESATPAACAKRVFVATGDVKIHAVDAETGKPCEDFGDHGQISTAEGMGPLFPGSYYQTSGGLIADDLLIVGGYVLDNQDFASPSGVIRAFNAKTGKLAWAWDIGRPGKTGAPEAGETYTHGTPNMWSVPSYDAELGLIYLPMGGDGTDMFGGQRTPEVERVAASIVALDAKSGQERWVFKTANHDVWDLDLPSKPILYDIPDGNGGRIPALIQTTKRGQIFVVDRRTGKPVTEVVERDVPQGGALGERLSPTQPYSVGMPAIRGPLFSEARMWGVTPFDQLSCRIAFKKVRYAGEFTPPGTDWYMPDPSPLGGMNWGGGSVDKSRDYLIVNDIRLMLRARLIPREQVEPALAASQKMTPGVGGIIPMVGTPYGAERVYINSPLGIPCGTPPFGTLTAIDLKTKKIAWQRSMGTAEEFGPWGTKTHLPVEIGMPTMGGAVTTSSGVVFFAGTSDYYLRAMDVNTGKELWKTPLPVGAQATPVVFQSKTNNKQYVVVTAGGSRSAPDRGDYIIAYTLDDK